MMNMLMNFGDIKLGWVKTIIESITKQVGPILTALAMLCFIVCLIGMLFSKNQKTVEEYKTWMKRIAVCYFAYLAIDVIFGFIKDIATTAKTGSSGGSGGNGGNSGGNGGNASA